ncbi:hypothetical protein MIR68_003957 [Amoeboaphelidium protococcarum]|nr:hypothetical protein MIR68_003957 [Amoeboaphelidium protococcarum]
MIIFLVAPDANLLVGLADPVGSWNPDGSFSEAVFFHKQKCNHNYTFGVNLMRRKPFMMYLSNLLTPGESQHLIQIARPLFRRSAVGSETDYSDVDEVRTSYSAYLTRSHDKVVKCIEQHVAQFVGKSVDCIEPLQVVWYREGQKYEPHDDWFSDNDDLNERLSNGVQREITIFGHLNTVDMEEHGGATACPEFDLEIPAKLGDAAFWYNIDENGVEDPLTLHGGSPIIGDAEKFGLNVWICQEAFVIQ